MKRMKKEAFKKMNEKYRTARTFLINYKMNCEPTDPTYQLVVEPISQTVKERIRKNKGNSKKN